MLLDLLHSGARPSDLSLATCKNNTAVMNGLLARLAPGDTLLVPPNNSFCMMGGITHGRNTRGLRDVVLRFDGNLVFWSPDSAMTDLHEWPVDPSSGPDKSVLECIDLWNMVNVTFTSIGDRGHRGGGVIDGSGANWWGYLKYAVRSENRPRLLHVRNSSQLLIENLLLKDSPCWTTYFDDVSDLVIRYTDIDVKVNQHATYHDRTELGAFNTDGFDVSGKNVHVHDCNVWNDDDCIAVKANGPRDQQSQCSENMLFERINASGIGLTIGSVGGGGDCVRNITFRDIVMPRTWKGIYVKARPTDCEDDANPGTFLPAPCGSISDVLYQNITMEQPMGEGSWAVWIGPQQAIYPGACSLFWPDTPGTSCPMTPNVSIADVTLRDVLIKSPSNSPGVLVGNHDRPMRNITFDNVTVLASGADKPLSPWGDAHYACYGVVGGIATGGTTPQPPCFNGNCVRDGQCISQATGDTPCCTGRRHVALDCEGAHGTSHRCGCLADGTCATSTLECCSNTSHHTANCLASGQTVRCGSADDAEARVASSRFAWGNSFKS